MLAVTLSILSCAGSDNLVASDVDHEPGLLAIERADFGVTSSNGDSMKASLYTLRNRAGLIAKITDFGANLVELWVPDRDGQMADIVLGFNNLADYETNEPSFGSTIGRVANRIAFGRFTLEGKEYELATNAGRHHLHGGVSGFNKALWIAETLETSEGPSLRLTYNSPDREEGYPGNVAATVVYTLTHDNELRVEMSATTDAPTIVNLAHHSYWNLAGHQSVDILNHQVTINASHYTPTDEELITTGAIDSVDGTPFDLRQPTRLGETLDALAASRSREPSGFDENFVVDGSSEELRPVARVEDPASGRVMELEADQPGVQFYTGNFLGGIAGKVGATYRKHQALCLETQLFPDAVNKADREGWRSPILRPGESYRHVMVHRFSVSE